LYAEYRLTVTNSEAREIRIFTKLTYVLIYYLFNNAVSSAGYLASNNSMTIELVNNDCLQNVKGGGSGLI
jgi:hypothetical protein